MSLTGRARPHTVTRNASFALRPQRVSAPPLVSSGVWRVRVCACARHRHALPTRQAITKKKTLQTPSSVRVRTCQTAVLTARVTSPSRCRAGGCGRASPSPPAGRALRTGLSTDSSRGSHVTAANGLGRREGPSRPPMEMFWFQPERDRRQVPTSPRPPPRPAAALPESWARGASSPAEGCRRRRGTGQGAAPAQRPSGTQCALSTPQH